MWDARESMRVFVRSFVVIAISHSIPLIRIQIFAFEFEFEFVQSLIFCVSLQMPFSNYFSAALANYLCTDDLFPNWIFQQPYSVFFFCWTVAIQCVRSARQPVHLLNFASPTWTYATYSSCSCFAQCLVWETIVFFVFILICAHFCFSLGGFFLAWKVC